MPGDKQLQNARRYDNFLEFQALDLIGRASEPEQGARDDDRPMQLHDSRQYRLIRKMTAKPGQVCRDIQTQANAGRIVGDRQDSREAVARAGQSDRPGIKVKFLHVTGFY